MGTIRPRPGPWENPPGPCARTAQKYHHRDNGAGSARCEKNLHPRRRIISPPPAPSGCHAASPRASPSAPDFPILLFPQAFREHQFTPASLSINDDEDDETPLAPTGTVAAAPTPIRRASRLLQRAMSTVRGDTAYDVVGEEHRVDGADSRFSQLGEVGEDAEAGEEESQPQQPHHHRQQPASGGAASPPRSRGDGVPSRFDPPSKSSSFLRRAAAEDREREMRDVESHGAGSPGRTRGALSVSAAEADPPELPPDSLAAKKLRKRNKRIALIVIGFLLFLLSTFLGGAAVVGFTKADRDKEFKAWKEQYGFDYGSRAENTRRYEIYVVVKSRVESLNAAPDSAATFAVRLAATAAGCEASKAA